MQQKLNIILSQCGSKYQTVSAISEIKTKIKSDMLLDCNSKNDGMTEDVLHKIFFNLYQKISLKRNGDIPLPLLNSYFKQSYK